MVAEEEEEEAVDVAEEVEVEEVVVHLLRITRQVQRIRPRLDN